MKNKIRDQLKEQRENLSKSDFSLISSDIVEQVRQTTEFRNANHIGFYHSIRQEADPGSLKTSAPEKTFYLPVLAKNKDEGLVFIESNKSTVFKNNKFSIPEPVYDENKVIKSCQLDLVIVPLVGFDSSGNRLGMGGGFYDRCFAFKLNQQKTPTTIGFAYDFQEITSLTPEHWDVPLDMIATQSRIIRIT